MITYVQNNVVRWLLAHGTKVDGAWAPHLWGERILFWAAYAPYILSSADSGYRSALLNTLARGARHLDANADKAPLGLRRVTAWCGVVAAGLLVQGGVPRVARGEAGRDLRVRRNDILTLEGAYVGAVSAAGVRDRPEVAGPMEPALVGGLARTSMPVVDRGAAW